MTEVCEAKRNWRGKSSQLIGQQQLNKANWFFWFRSRHHQRNLFHFSQREKIVFRSSKLHINSSFFTLRFVSRKKVKKKFVLTYKFFFVTSIQFVACALRENLSSRSSGVQIPRDICTRLGRYLYSTKCSWIIRELILTLNVTLLISSPKKIRIGCRGKY